MSRIFYRLQMSVAGLPEHIDMTENTAAVSAPPPIWLMAELTYGCQLHCVFCSNPRNYAANATELNTAQRTDWKPHAPRHSARRVGLRETHSLVSGSQRQR